MIELTLEQRQAVSKYGETPARAIDPDTDTTYVLISEAVYARLKLLLIEEQNSQFLDEMYLPTMEVFGREGWDDPAMDIYNAISILGDRHEYSTR